VHLNIEVTVARSRANIKPRSHRRRFGTARTSAACFNPARARVSHLDRYFPACFPASRFPPPSARRGDSTTSNSSRLRSIDRERTADFLSSVPLGRVRLISLAIAANAAAMPPVSFRPFSDFRLSRCILEIPQLRPRRAEITDQLVRLIFLSLSLWFSLSRGGSDCE